uniref:Uncharacterized protein n=1 Tax=Anguilla anguilla TaxID=7936 RepID=A0A0E9QWG5_ANGAN
MASIGSPPVDLTVYHSFEIQRHSRLQTSIDGLGKWGGLCNTNTGS